MNGVFRLICICTYVQYALNSLIVKLMPLLHKSAFKSWTSTPRHSDDADAHIILLACFCSHRCSCSSLVKSKEAIITKSIKGRRRTARRCCVINYWRDISMTSHNIMYLLNEYTFCYGYILYYTYYYEHVIHDIAWQMKRPSAFCKTKNFLWIKMQIFQRRCLLLTAFVLIRNHLNDE